MHQEGIKHQAADVLSHLPTSEKDLMALGDSLHILSVDASKNYKYINVNDANCQEVLLLKADPPLADNKPLSEVEMILEQADETNCNLVTAQVSHPSSEFEVDKKGLLI